MLGAGWVLEPHAEVMRRMACSWLGREEGDVYDQTCSIDLVG